MRHPAQFFYDLGRPIKAAANADRAHRARLFAGVQPRGLLCQIGVEAKFLRGQVRLGYLFQRGEFAVLVSRLIRGLLC